MALLRLSKHLALVAGVAMLAAGCAVAPGPGPDQDGTASKPARATGMSSDQAARFESGASALRAGNAERAAEVFDALAREVPGLAEAHANLGTARMLQSRDDEARAAFEKAVELEPGLTEALIRLGVLYRRDGQFRKAEQAYKAALNAEPENRYANLNLGILYDVYLRRPQQALTHYERFQALSEQPDDEVALWIADIKQRL